MRRHRRTPAILAQESQEQEYWLSYSDVMAGLLMVFALMLFSALHHYQRRVVEVRDILEVRRQIATSLMETFGQVPSLNVEVDSTTGAIRFRDQILFDEASAVLRPEGRAQLEAFATNYFAVLLGTPAYIEQLDEVVVEGHTNDNGPYMYNLRLSQDRAYAVMEFLLNNANLPSTDLKRFVTANGRSYARLVMTDEGEVDKERSRRIEIRFRLKDEEIIRRLMERLRTG
jgi:chemotaxis protein MotB